MHGLHVVRFLEHNNILDHSLAAKKVQKCKESSFCRTINNQVLSMFEYKGTRNRPKKCISHNKSISKQVHSHQLLDLAPHQFENQMRQAAVQCCPKFQPMLSKILAKSTLTKQVKQSKLDVNYLKSSVYSPLFCAKQYSNLLYYGNENKQQYLLNYYTIQISN